VGISTAEVIKAHKVIMLGETSYFEEEQCITIAKEKRVAPYNCTCTIT